MEVAFGEHLLDGLPGALLERAYLGRRWLRFVAMLPRMIEPLVCG